MPRRRKLLAFEDPAHEGNSAQHHTGKKCVEQGCDRPAGTAWSPLWCHPCNVERMRRISSNLEAMTGRGRGNAVTALAELLRKTGGQARLHRPVQSPYAHYPADDDTSSPESD